MAYKDITEYGFGQNGSTYLTGSGAKLDLSLATSKYYIIAITFTEDATFTNLEIMDRGVGLAMPNTHCPTTEDLGDIAGTTGLTDDWGAETGYGDNDAIVVTNTHVFPRGVTMYGMWDKIVLNSGACIVYVAPRPDYSKRTGS